MITNIRLAAVPILSFLALSSSASAQPKPFKSDENFQKTYVKVKESTSASSKALVAEQGASAANLYTNPFLWLGVGFVLLSIGAWVYVKLSATTDPQSLAATDPWIQDRIAQSQANARSDEERGHTT